MNKSNKNHITTRILHKDNQISSTRGTINPPVHHASTLLFDRVKDLKNAGTQKLEPGQNTYAIHGTTIHFALAQAITQLENGHDTILTSSGLMAITLALGAILKSGDHLLMTDSVYGPTRAFCDHVLRQRNIETTYYDPRIGAEIESLIQKNTNAIFLESPGSYTFEIQDTPTIAAIAKRNNIITLCDNTWSTPLYYQPLSFGVDISIHAATKYFSGHSDVMLGSITANETTYPIIHNYARLMGNHAAPDDCYLVMRGLRTLPLRLKQHEENAYKLAQWLAQRAEVKFVIHPGRDDHPDHALWQRDFIGASGLFAFVMKPVKKQSLAHMLDKMKLFGMGFSWGGYESLLIPGYLSNLRTVIPWDKSNLLLRIHVGLENTDDLIADLGAGFDRIKKA